jgi:hypothetical protein
MQITRIRRLPFSFVRVEASGTITTLSSTDYPPMVMELTLLECRQTSVNLSQVSGCLRANGSTPSQTWSGQLFSTLNGRCFSAVVIFLISSSVCSFPPFPHLLTLHNSHLSHPFLSHFFTFQAACCRLCCNLLTSEAMHSYCAPGCTEVAYYRRCAFKRSFD